MHPHAALSRAFTGHRALAGLAAACCLAAATSAAAEEYQIIQSATSYVSNDLVRTESIVQVGSDPINRFSMVRVAKDIPPQAFNGSVLLLPSLGNGVVGYEVTASGDYTESFVALFALLGYEVWGLSNRADGLMPGTCEATPTTCDAMADWGLQTLLEDTEFVRGQIVAMHPGRRPVVGGLSLGSMAATAAINARPDDYAGAILIEGALYDANEANQATARMFCRQYESMLEQGVYYDAQSLSGIKFVAGLATSDPDGLSPLPGFPTGYTNHQVFVALMSNPGIGPITPREDYFFLAGNPNADRFVFADDASVRANIATFANYASVRMIHDVDCALAGETTTFTDNLGSFHGPVLMFGGGHGFGPAMLDTAAHLLTNAEVTMYYKQSFGHVDHFFAAAQGLSMGKPIHDWIEASLSL